MNTRLPSNTMPVHAACFGKLPSQPDFVRDSRHPRLEAWIDRWLSQALESAASDAHWKRLYDSAPALDFAVLGPASPIAVAGHLRPSRDAAGRRFPFAVALQCDSTMPRLRAARAPLVFARTWQRCAEAAGRAAARPLRPAAVVEHELAALRVPEPWDYEASCADHAALETLGGLEARLRPAHPEIDLRATLLALGALLQPLARRGAGVPARGLSLPLPSTAAEQPVVAAWWTSLVADALGAAGHDWLLLRPGGGAGASPRLLLEFSGACAEALQAAWDPHRCAERYVDLAAPAWAEAVAERNEHTRRLAAYLNHGSLSLALAAASWREAFAADGP
ncbi:type VI secretion system-associated protein TagF [Rubrivivax sp. JA1026]|uniref:type VI secretion system-associated protein TagF n=1 Tax=Rubrivivax sp. JA1026 TaxID=2710888 RepID=UPI0013E95611|nr:type VI secretion system-associated protein TagF [Rubrivivax sp. JA1026]